MSAAASRPSLAAVSGSPHAVLLGLGSYRPERVVPNAELVEAIDSSDEWIQQRSGIRERRFASAEETLQMMAVTAARRALERADVEASRIDGVIVATVTHLVPMPALAPLVAHELGCGQPVAFDVAAACAGFCHGVALAADMVRSGSAHHVLVIGADRLTDLLDPTDRGTAFIFGDGAGAVVVGPGDTPGIGPVVWGSDGGRADLIGTDDWRDVLELAGGQHPPVPYLRMQGSSVFRWAAFAMAEVALQALERAGVTVEDLDLFVPHQANMRITDAMARTMKLPASVRIARDIAEQGNTSAASIPLALDRLVADGEAHPGDLALFVAFGAGLAYAAQVVVVP